MRSPGVAILLLIIITSHSALAQVPFSKGINLTQWFQTSGPRQIQFTKYTKQDFIKIKSLGCDVIRLPINLHFMTSGAPDYVIDPLFFSFLDEVINWADELEMHLILDNHTFDPAADTDPGIGSVLVKVWSQLAERYENRSEFLYYEILNEPHGIADATWGQIQQNVIDAIRIVDTRHTIIVGGTGWNSFHNLQFIPNYTDDNLIYTFHFYDPFVFTHQGASWTNPSMASLTGVPFPYEASRMPPVPDNLRGTWIENRMNTYWNVGTEANVREKIDIAVNFREDRKVPIFCGEFGAYIPNSDNEDRAKYYQLVRTYFEQNDIAWTSWDYQGGFGLFEANSNGLFDYDLNLPLIEALGFIPPVQKELVIEPEQEGFYMYDDFFGLNIFESSSAGEGIIDFYNYDVFRGEYSIKWENANQFSSIGFNFKPERDLSQLADGGYVLDFWAKGNTPGAQFQVRFVDTKTDQEADHPWRMGYDVRDTGNRWNGSWRHFRIPLQDFEDLGSWDNGTWFPSIGAFDWSRVDELEIVAEAETLDGTEFWFDEIRISNEVVTGIFDPEHFSEAGIGVFPNPAFNQPINIQYSLADNSRVDLSVYHVSGEKIITLVGETQPAGKHAVVWDARSGSGVAVSSGMYLCTLQTQDGSWTYKILLGL